VEYGRAERQRLRYCLEAGTLGVPSILENVSVVLRGFREHILTKSALLYASKLGKKRQSLKPSALKSSVFPSWLRRDVAIKDVACPRFGTAVHCYAIAASLVAEVLLGMLSSRPLSTCLAANSDGSIPIQHVL